jgi:PqqD family protein of HPr-rel-A system
MWQVTPGQSLRYRAWGDESVLYNDLSGDTHLLGAGALHLLLALQHGAAGEALLAASLRAACPSADEAELAVLLAELAALSLIEVVPC